MLEILWRVIKNNENQEIKETESQVQINTEEMTVEQAIAKRKSTRDYVSGQIPLSIIRDILYDSTSVNFLEEYESHYDLRLVVGEIEGLTGGMYSYSLNNHTLTLYYLY